MESVPSFPQSFRPLVWSIDPKQLDIQKHRRYIVHQLLSLGDLDAFRWLQETYSLPTLRDIFIHSPERVYTNHSFSFVSKFLLHLNQNQVERARYVAMAS